MERQNHSEKLLSNRHSKQISSDASTKALRQMPKTSKIGIGAVASKFQSLISQVVLQQKSQGNLFKINKRLYPSLKPLKPNKPLQPLTSINMSLKNESDDKIRGQLKSQEFQIMSKSLKTQRIIKNQIQKISLFQQLSNVSDLRCLEKKTIECIDKFYQQNNAVGVSLKIINSEDSDDTHSGE